MLNLLRAARAQTGDEADAEGVDPQQSNASVLSDLYRRFRSVSNRIRNV